METMQPDGRVQKIRRESPIYDSPLYPELVQAYRQGDHVQIGRLRQRTLSDTQGEEQTAWHMYWTGQHWSQVISEQGYAAGMKVIVGDLLTEQDDPILHHYALVMITGINLLYERLDGLHMVMNVIRSNLPQVIVGWSLPFNLGLSLFRRREWASAELQLLRTIDALDKCGPVQREGMRGYRCPLNAAAAVAAYRAGNRQRASVLSQEAEAVYRSFPRGYLDAHWITLMRAEFALGAGRPAEARQALQEGRVLYAEGKKRMDPYASATFDLMAARIARFEGNTEGFLHFAEAALATCQAHHLRWTERAIRAVMAGAEV